MAQDYATGLTRGRGGGAPPPKAEPAVNAELAAREEASRASDAKQGRYGRWVDSAGNWATCWQAPLPGTAIGQSPAFIAPARVVRFKSGEMALQQEPDEAGESPTSSFIAPGAWVVRYDGAGEEASVVSDADFR